MVDALLENEIDRQTPLLIQLIKDEELSGGEGGRKSQGGGRDGVTVILFDRTRDVT